jgi:2-keto-4-pentenoate hydratase
MSMQHKPRALDEMKLAGLVDAMAVQSSSSTRAGAKARAPRRCCAWPTRAVHGALVLGAWVPYVARDWSTQPCRVLRSDHVPPLERSGTHPLGDPAWLLPQWLRHATRHGATLRAGTVVTTGAWIVVPDGGPVRR